MRLRGVKADDDTDELVPNLERVIEEVTNINGQGGVKIKIDEHTFKSTYQILKEISKVWEQIDDDSQAMLLEKIAGKHRANVLASVLNNSELLESAYSDAMTSEGSAMTELEKRLKSIESHVNQLKVAWSDLARHTMNSELIIGVVDLLTNLVKLIDKIGVAKIALIGFIAILSTLKAKNLAFALAASQIGDVGDAARNATTKVSIFSLGLKGLAKAFAPLMIITAVIALFDQFHESLAEKQEEIDSITNDVERLKEEYEELNQTIGKSEADKKQLEYLENEIALREKILEIKERELAQDKADKFTFKTWRNFGIGNSVGAANNLGGNPNGDVEFDLNDYVKQKEKVEELKKSINDLMVSRDKYNSSTQEYANLNDEISNKTDKLAKEEEKLLKVEEKAADGIQATLELRDTLTAAYDVSTGKKKAEYKAAIDNIDAFIAEADAIMSLTGAMQVDAQTEYAQRAADCKEQLAVLVDIIEKVNSGYAWQQSEVDALVKKYPNLENIFKSYSKNTKNGILLQIEALSDLGNVESEVTKAYLQNQLSMTEAAIKESKKRIEAYSSELNVLETMIGRKNTGYKDFIDDDVVFFNPLQKLQYDKLNEQLDNEEQEISSFVLQRSEIEKALANISGISSGSYSSSSSKDSKNKNTAKYFGIDIDSVIAEIEAMDDDVVRAIDDTQAKIEKAVLNGDNDLELGLQENLAKYYTEQLRINAEQIHKFENEKDYYVDELKKLNYSAFEGQDLSKLTQRQLDMAIRNFEIEIDAASVAGKDDLTYSLTRQKEALENYGKGIVDTTEKIKEYNSEALEIQNSILEQNIALIKRKLELEQQAFDEKTKLLELEQILMEEESAEYAEIEAKKYNIILDNQESIMRTINKYREQGLADTSEEIMDLKDQWYDYESDRLNVIKDFQNRKKKLEEDYKSKSISLEKSIQDTISSIYKEAVDKRKSELEKELSAYQDQIDDMLQKMDREDSTRTFEQQQEEQTKEILDMEDEISKYKLAAADGDKAAALKVKELEEKLAESKKKLTELQYNREKELRKNNLNDAKESAEKETEKKKEELDNQYENAANNLGNIKDLVSLTNEEIEAMVQAFFENVGASADDYQTKIDELIDKKKELIDITRELAAVDSVLPSFNKNDSDKYNPNNSNNKPPQNNSPDINKNGMTLEEAKRAFQLEQRGYLNSLMVNNGDWEKGEDKDKGLTQWVLQERAKWGLDQWGGIVEEGKVPEEYMDELRKKYGFAKGGQTQRTGWHWLDGKPGRPEEVLSNDDTKYWRQMIDLSPEFLKAMSSVSSIKASSTVQPVDIHIDSLITVEGNMDKNIIPEVRNAGNELLDALSEAVVRKTGGK